MAASAASAAARIAAIGAAERSGPRSSSRSSSVAASVDENVLVITGTTDGPPADRTTSEATRVSVDPGTWTMPAIGIRPRTSSATATTSLNSPDDEMPTMASPASRTCGYVRNSADVIGITTGSSGPA